ncbi:MAG: ComEC/Rec2 family competence protein, partial [Huintestinicola sp.]
LIRSGADIDVTAYKVGHHGSSSSSSEKFLEKVTPRLCVISCGEGNSYGHPNPQAVSRLEEYTSSIYRTDLCGSVSVYSDGKKLYVSKQGGAS